MDWMDGWIGWMDRMDGMYIIGFQTRGKHNQKGASAERNLFFAAMSLTTVFEQKS